ncbi:putative histone lysine methyltransferase, SET [Besnoitia besnoiti]|uniref:Putative histone lysine methyltransferase, SET n=1 Tax=Besnoitia besnoiti TaxID=94643 RepID=A0A2A9M621_BESBE|nr:putative histone lysine methyltransferase, SET [Besnoitia besnoiti]PFH33415.1 putative histone lysine methyltransferase, SET [Besnoitia besnoiti]
MSVPSGRPCGLGKKDALEESPAVSCLSESSAETSVVSTPCLSTSFPSFGTRQTVVFLSESPPGVPSSPSSLSSSPPVLRSTLAASAQRDSALERDSLACADPRTGSFLSPSALFVSASLIPLAGQGLFTSQHIPRGTWICEYLGKCLSLRELLREEDRAYVICAGALNAHIDAKSHLEVFARYINDISDKEKLNACFVKDKKRRRVFVQALRDIHAGEEIYAFYGEGYWRQRECFSWAEEDARTAAVGKTTGGAEAEGCVLEKQREKGGASQASSKADGKSEGKEERGTEK